MFLFFHYVFGSVGSAMLGEQGAGIQGRLLCSDLHVGGSKGMDTMRRFALMSPIIPEAMAQAPAKPKPQVCAPRPKARQPGPEPCAVPLLQLV
jgi:hypothetical protein